MPSAVKPTRKETVKNLEGRVVGSYVLHRERSVLRSATQVGYR